MGALPEHLKPGESVGVVEIRVVRSLANFVLMPKMGAEDLKNTERIVKEALKKLDKEYAGSYYSIQSTLASPQLEDSLAKEDILFYQNHHQQSSSNADRWVICSFECSKKSTCKNS